MNNATLNNNISIAEKSLANQPPSKNLKYQKIAKYWLNRLTNPDIPYFHKKVLLQVLPHFNKDLNTTYVPCSEVYKLFTPKRKDFEEGLGNIEQTLGLTFNPLDAKKKSLKSGSNAKYYAIRIDNKIKSECLKDTHGYSYLRQDFVPWFHNVVSKYNLKNAKSIDCFFNLAITVSTWDILVNINIKKLAEKIKMPSVRRREKSNMNQLIKKYLHILAQEGLIMPSEVTTPSQVVFKPINCNSERKDLKTQQKEEAKKQEQEQEQEEKSKKVIKLSPKNQTQNIKTEPQPAVKIQKSFAQKKTTQKPIKGKDGKKPLITT